MRFVHELRKVVVPAFCCVVVLCYPHKLTGGLVTAALTSVVDWLCTRHATGTKRGK